MTTFQLMNLILDATKETSILRLLCRPLAGEVGLSRPSPGVEPFFTLACAVDIRQGRNTLRCNRPHASTQSINSVQVKPHFFATLKNIYIDILEIWIFTNPEDLNDMTALMGNFLPRSHL